MAGDRTWTIDSILRVTKEFFAGKGIESARLDAEILLTSVIDLTRVQLYTQYDRPLSEEELTRYRELVRRRGGLGARHQNLGPHLEAPAVKLFLPEVLVPRPETEHLIDAVLEWGKSQPIRRVLDVGTGSGCIAVTLACEIEGVEVVASDISPEALRTAEKNAGLHGVDCAWHEADVYPPGAEKFSVIASNPPYIANGDVRVEAGVHHHEPSLALYSGDDGLDVIRRLVEGAPERLDRPGLLAFELGAGQDEAVRSLVPSVRFVEDLQRIPRIALVEYA